MVWTISFRLHAYLSGGDGEPDVVGVEVEVYYSSGVLAVLFGVRTMKRLCKVYM